ncbi:uncharacterized protein YcnI [Diaminobutyricimonas aerilata]|uniref:Uncharacterized protein YcnI n=1 Tax=Diaminobutyricimonas aerilata TaxID=1162967 RepID=A0A2M9CJ59_9MICO|nr:YcnI family protein [Diaminobutyricimonas aerilata]PJJ71943.1 uncharacterized protein YcnI [Diaminobutyricimonas aerilata]
MRTRTFTLPALALLAGGALAVAAPLAASAHVTVAPDDVDPGDYALVTVKVPNESATAGTSQVAMTLPSDTPFTSVRFVPVPGWTVELQRETLDEPVTVGENEITEAVTRVVWTAAPGSEIADGQLQTFQLSLGPVPDTGTVLLPTDQTYTDGEVVSWSEEDPDAEHPAPALYVNDEPAGGHHGAAADDHGSDAAEPETDSAAQTTDAAPVDVLARVLGVLGLVVGAVGVVIALLSRRRAA